MKHVSIDPDLATAAAALPGDYVQQFRALLAGAQPLSSWNGWWAAHAADLERIVGPATFKWIKRNPLRTLGEILTARGVPLPQPPDIGPITPQEYAVNSAAIRHAAWYEPPEDGALTVHARTRALRWDRGSIGRLGAAEELSALGPDVLDALYLRNFRTYDLEPALSLGRPYRLVPTADIPPRPGGWPFWEVGHVAFGADGRVALASWHRHHSHGHNAYAAVVRAVEGASPTTAEAWSVGPKVMVDSLSIN